MGSSKECVRVLKGFSIGAVLVGMGLRVSCSKCKVGPSVTLLAIDQASMSYYPLNALM